MAWVEQGLDQIMFGIRHKFWYADNIHGNLYKIFRIMRKVYESISISCAGKLLETKQVEKLMCASMYI